MDGSLSHVLDYGVDEMVVGDRDHLWHHIKPHTCFQHQEQMIIVAGKGLTVTDIHGREYLDATSGGVYLVIDEVVAGFGRTGKFFGHQHFDVDPDMITLAKGMASAYEPISATVVKQHLYDLFLNDPADPDKRMHFFRDISTYGGCAGVMAASLENIRIMETENLVENSRVMGDYLLGRLEELQDHPAVGDVRGKGLFCGVELVAHKQDKQPPSEAQIGAVVDAVKAEGVLLGRTNSSLPGLNTTLYYAPALVITKDEADRMVNATQKGIEKVFG